MCSTPASRSSAGRGSGGFTLVELLVALTLGGLLAGVVLRLVQASGDLLRLQAAREEVQQNGRAALDLIAAELRALPPTALVEMGAGSIRFHLPRAWGVLCGPLAAGDSDAAALFGAGTVPTDEDLWARPHWGIAVEQTTDPSAGTGAYRFVANVEPRTAGPSCDAVRPADAAGPPPDRYGFSARGRSFVSAGVVPAGARVLLFEEVRYDVAEGGAAPGHWIRRMAGYAGAGPNMQPMAGPVPGPTALSFEYLREDGATPATVAAEVRTVRVTLVTESRARTVRGGGTAPASTDTVTAEIHLRN